MGNSKGKKGLQSKARKEDDNTTPRDTAIIFAGGFILALLLQKAAYYCDWDTIDSVLRMNLAGYNPLSVPPVKYHLLIEPAVFAITAILAPVFGRDHMVGFIVLVSLFSAGLLALAYYAVRRVTGDRLAAIISVAFIAVSYNYLFLTLSTTQNIVNQFFNLLTVLLALMLAGRIKTRLDRNTLAIALGLAIGLAVGTNMRSLYLLVVLPLIALLGTDRKVAIKAAAIAGLCAIIAIACLAVISNALGLSSGLTGFFTVVYYEKPEFWFFAGQHDLAGQAVNASVGFLRSLISDNPTIALDTASPYLLVLAAIAVTGLFIYLLRSSVQDSAVIMVAALLLLNSAHSFFYEPTSFERWDHAVLFLALLAGIAWADKAGRYNKILIGLLLAVMAIGLLVTISAAGSSTLYVSFLYGKLPAGEFHDNPGLLVITPEEGAVTGRYMVYLFGRDNVCYASEFNSMADLTAFANNVHTNRTLYLDSMIYDSLEEVNGTELLLQSAEPIDTYGMWYRIDRASNGQ